MVRTVSKPKVMSVLMSSAYSPLPDEPDWACAGAASTSEVLITMSNRLVAMDKDVLNMI